MLIPISKKKFDIFVGFSRKIQLPFFTEIAWFSNKDESILATIVKNHQDNDYPAILLGRDEIGRFRNFCERPSFQSINEAISWIEIRCKALEGKKIFPQSDCDYKPMSLFRDAVPLKKLNPHYLNLKEKKEWYCAKRVIEEILPYFFDVDGNFIQQFQTTGFDQRIWELFLFSYFNEEGLVIDKTHNAPDFILSIGDESVCIEATTLSRRNNQHSSGHKVPDVAYLQNEMPILWSGALNDKLIKMTSEFKNAEKTHYWEKSYTKGKPFAIAIQDFHDDFSMTWSHDSLIELLYGIRYFQNPEDHKIQLKKIDYYTKSNGTKISSGLFFNHPESKNLSAVVSCPIGTLSKFNRIGKQAGFDIYDTEMLCKGFCYNHEPNATTPNMFKYFITEMGDESWSTGVNVFHNPEARFPLPEKFFLNAAHHYFENGQIKSLMPPYHPYSMITDLISKE